MIDLFRITREDLARATREAERRRHRLLGKAARKAVKARERNKRKAHRLRVAAAKEVRAIVAPRSWRPPVAGHKVLLDRMEPGRCYTVAELAALVPEWPGGYRSVQPWLYQRLDPAGLVEKVRVREYSDAAHRARLNLFVWRLTEEGAAHRGAAA